MITRAYGPGISRPDLFRALARTYVGFLNRRAEIAAPAPAACPSYLCPFFGIFAPDLRA